MEIVIDQSIVKIIAERIMNNGINPLRKRPYKLSDISNTAYKAAVEDYITKQVEK